MIPLHIRNDNHLGKEVFPLIPMKFYPNVNQSIRVEPSDFPLVAKVGTSHAGYGKMQFKDNEFNDFSTGAAIILA